jgi:hypothetical protein
MEKGVLQLGPWRALCYDRWWGRRANVRAAVLGPDMIVAGPAVKGEGSATARAVEAQLK